ncbi:MAG TPA: tRNA pseudouridine(55) synthase TruB [Polyangiaceae bacterium]
MAPDGLLVVDKPEGPTSHDIVARARRLFSTRSVGHAGTLDPMATGVLVLLFGEALKLSSYLTLDEKAYVAEVTFGVATDTLDAKGTVTLEAPLPPDALEPARVAAALAAERDRTLQVPPAVSAIKVGGERAHRLTRRGTTPVLEPRPIRVERLELLESHAERLTVAVSASKGYYVRSLARDLGAALGVPAHLSRLRRTRSGAFTVENATPWPPPELPALLPVVRAAEHALPRAELTTAGAAKARLGQRLGTEHFAVAPASEGPHAWLDPDGGLVAIGQSSEQSFRVLRGFRA